MKDYKDFLIKHSVKNSKLPITHTRIGDKELNIYGGAYHIPQDELTEFHKLYYEHVFINGNKEYLTEKQTGNGPFVVDLDLRYCHDVKSRQHTKKHVEDIIMLYLEQLKEHLNFEPDKQFDIFAFEKPNVNRLADGSLTKDGIHFIFGLKVDFSVQQSIRNNILTMENELNELDLPLLNSWESVLDEGISKGCTNWQLFGSRKPDNEAYEMTYHYSIELDGTDNEFMMNEQDVKAFDIKNNFHLLSVQHNQNPEFEINQSKLKIGKTSKLLKNKLPSSPSPSSVTESIPSGTSLELIELLDGIKINPKDRLWLRICSCLKQNGYNDDDWLRFCKNNDLNMDNEKLNLFDTIGTDGELSIHYLESLFKKCNYNGYKDWCVKYKRYLKLKTLEQGSNDLGEWVKDKLKVNLVYCNDNWIQYDKQNKLWKIVKKPDAIITSHIQSEIDISKEMLLCVKNRTDDEVLKKKLEENEKQYNKFRTIITGCGYMSQLKNYLTTYLCDNYFDKKLDRHTYKMAFQNGMLDLTTFQLQPLCQEHFITKTIPYDWEVPKKSDKDSVRTMLKKITNWNDSHLEYYLSILGYAMTGDSSREQMFWYFRGETAENGKSVIFEILEKIMPNYVEKSTPEFLDKKYDIKKEVPTWNGKRIIWVNELSTEKKNEDLVKSICDGTDYKYNRNYAIESQKVPIGFKLFCVSNNSLNIKADNGIIRRFRLCQFGSQFKADNVEDDYENLQFIRNKYLVDELTGTLRNALLALIFDYSKTYYEDKCLKPYPNEWKQDADEVMEDNNKFQSWFNDNFDIGKEFKIYKGELDNIIPIEFKNIKVKDELKRMKICHEYKSQHQEYNPDRQKGWWFGFQLKKEEGN